MTDILNEAYGVIQCKECPWYKSMRFTAEDLRRQLESQIPGGSSSMPNDAGLQNLLSSMATSAQNSLLEGCPIFVERLRNSQELAAEIKKLMQNFGKQDLRLDNPKP
jgi:hypothetical protein